MSNQAQAAVTKAHEFHRRDADGNHFMSVLEGIPAEGALQESSNLLAGTIELISDIPENGLDGNAAYAVQFLLKAAKALLDAGTAAY